MTALANQHEPQTPQGLRELLDALNHQSHGGGGSVCAASVASSTSELRAQARAALPPGTPWPSSKQAAWRYTPMTGLVGHTWQNPSRQPLTPAAALSALEVAQPLIEKELPAGAAAQPAILTQLSGSRLVFVDGHFSPSLSRNSPQTPAIPGLWFGRLADLEAAAPSWLPEIFAAQRMLEDSPLAALNAAATADTTVVHLAANTQLTAPLHIIHLQSAQQAAATLTLPRTVIVAGVHSALRVYEHYLSEGGAPLWCNAVTEVSLAQGAHLQHICQQNEANGVQHTSALRASLARTAHLDAFALMSGGRMARHAVQVFLDGSGAHAKLSGLYLGRGPAHQGFVVDVHHRQPHTSSHQHFRGILDDDATGAFVGTVHVAPGAHKTQARQLCRSLLRSNRARAHAQPQLEILTDDVVCTHGATVGQLDPAAVFYLQSRGLDARAAQKLLTYAYAAEVVADAPTAAQPGLYAALLQALQMAEEGNQPGLGVQGGAWP